MWGSGLSSIMNPGVRASLQPPPMGAGAGGHSTSIRAPGPPTMGSLRVTSSLTAISAALGSPPSLEMEPGLLFSPPPPNGSRAGGDPRRSGGAEPPSMGSLSITSSLTARQWRLFSPPASSHGSRARWAQSHGAETPSAGSLGVINSLTTTRASLRPPSGSGSPQGGLGASAWGHQA